MKKYTLILLILSAITAGCKSDNNGFENEQNSYLLYGLVGQPSNECLQAVTTLNLCVSDGYGFDPNIMCSPGQLSTFTPADYTALTSCAEGVIAATACNLDVNMVATAQIAADPDTGVFAACDVSAANPTAPAGILVP